MFHSGTAAAEQACVLLPAVAVECAAATGRASFAIRQRRGNQGGSPSEQEQVSDEWPKGYSLRAAASKLGNHISQTKIGCCSLSELRQLRGGDDPGRNLSSVTTNMEGVIT